MDLVPQAWPGSPQSRIDFNNRDGLVKLGLQLSQLGLQDLGFGPWDCVGQPRLQFSDSLLKPVSSRWASRTSLASLRSQQAGRGSLAFLRSRCMTGVCLTPFAGQITTLPSTFASHIHHSLWCFYLFSVFTAKLGHDSQDLLSLDGLTDFLQTQI